MPSHNTYSFNLSSVLTLSAAAMLFLLFSCLENDINTEPSVIVQFSTDTLRFDTVFTTIGSATRSFRILNPESQDVILTSVSLENGSSTKFRLNVDGVASNQVSDVRVPAKDSIWVFAEVTVDPDQPLSISPFVIQEGLLVNVNGNVQRVILEAWGQNANYISPKNSTGRFTILDCDGGVLNWNDPKPYILYGVVVINNCELRIPAGARIHVHGGITNDDGSFRNDGFLIISPTSSIQASGSFGNPIVFQGDRLETEFENEKGQWGGLLIDAASSNNTLDYVEIKNSIIGLRTDSLTEVSISNTKIFNTSGSGILARNSILNISNTLIHSNNIRALEIAFGGVYTIQHSTLINYLNNDLGVLVTNRICREVNEIGQCVSFDVSPLSIQFNNVVIAGNEEEEIGFIDESDGGSEFDVQFSNCAIQVDENNSDASLIDFLASNCTDCQFITLRDTIFRNESELDFHPDTLSVLSNQGLFDANYPCDLDMVMRFSESTDIGCYEFVPR